MGFAKTAAQKIGPRGYTFAMLKLEDIYIVKHIDNILIPDYLHQMEDLSESLSNLYHWRNYQVSLKERILSAVIESANAKFFDNLTTQQNKKALSPNIYLKPTKPRNTV